MVYSVVFVVYMLILSDEGVKPEAAVTTIGYKYLKFKTFKSTHFEF